MNDRLRTSWLFDEIDNRALIVFRVFFGFLLFAEAAGAIATGWVKRTLIEPDFTFSFIDFPWIQPLPGNGMYFYYAIMAVLGLMVMLGWRYRISLGLFTIMWTGTYLMQKSNYNNHYYLLILLCLCMLIVPAHRYYSLDVRRDPSLKSETMPRWCQWIFVVQLWIVYTWAGIVKFYPGWLEGDFIATAFVAKASYPVIGGLLQEQIIQQTIIYGGILFDLFIIYLLLWNRTRWMGLIFSVIFHLSNSIIFQIGIFPYLMLAMDVFFFSTEQTSQVFFKKRPPSQDVLANDPLSPQRKMLLSGLAFYMLFQIVLPARPYLFKGNTFWTEEGHRMSWRMMLRSKYGSIHFKVMDPATGKSENVYPGKYLHRDQLSSMAGKPDMIWQFVQRLKQEYASAGRPDIEIYAVSRVSLNGSAMRPIIDPHVDLAKVDWEPFRHSEWILWYGFDE